MEKNLQGIKPDICPFCHYLLGVADYIHGCNARTAEGTKIESAGIYTERVGDWQFFFRTNSRSTSYLRRHEVSTIVRELCLKSN